jgi:hypothetical protein
MTTPPKLSMTLDKRAFNISLENYELKWEKINGKLE